MPSFTHCGDMGDIIYCLPTIRVLGGGTLYLQKAEYTRLQVTQRTLDLLGPLLEAQDYPLKLALYRGEAVRYDLNGFRNVLSPEFDYLANTAVSHLRPFGLPENEVEIPWIRVPEKIEKAEVVINLTPRYRNRFFPWKKVVEKYKGRCVFVGMPNEHQEFVWNYGNIPHYKNKTLMDLAQVIAGAKLFIGNQSCPYAIAEGMKQNTIQEVSLTLPNCIFRRPNAQYVAGARIHLPDI